MLLIHRNATLNTFTYYGLNLVRVSQLRDVHLERIRQLTKTRSSVTYDAGKYFLISPDDQVVSDGSKEVDNIPSDIAAVLGFGFDLPPPCAHKIMRTSEGPHKETLHVGYVLTKLLTCLWRQILGQIHQTY